MALQMVHYEVLINQIGPVGEGFLDDRAPANYVPFPTTLAAGISKSKANLRWRIMMWYLGENFSPVNVFNIQKTGTNLHNNPPTSISFVVTYDKRYQIKTKDENSGTFYSISLGAITNSGNGYSPGDVLTVSGGTALKLARMRVLSCTQTGQINAIEMITDGYYTALPTNPVSVTGGTGTGAQFLMTSKQNPGLPEDLAVRRLCARALMYQNPSQNYEIYDPTPTLPLGPPPKPPIARTPQKIISLTMVSLAANLAAAESAITVTEII